METRKERFTKYREQIKLTPNDQFPSKRRPTSLTSDDISLLSSVDKPSTAISYGSLLEPLNGRLEPAATKVVSPYERYLSHKRSGLIVKFVLLGIAVAAMVVWYFFMQRSK
jgi:hypothetical protein